MMRSVAVVGAAGSIGSATCFAASEGGMAVIAIDRDFNGIERLAGVDYRVADVKADDLADVLAGADAVISTLGLAFTPHNALTPPPLYTHGTEAIVTGMRRHGTRRLAVISAAFVVPQPSLPLWFAMSVVPALHAILEQMRGMEAIVAASDLDWTIARPGWLLDEPATGTLLAQDEMLADGAFRCREGDLARFLVDTVGGAAWLRQRPALGAPDSAVNESPLALGKALAELVPGLGG